MSDVFAAKNRRSKGEFAIKVTDKRKMNQQDIEDFEGELKIMEICDHPCIVTQVKTFEDKFRFFQVYELMKGGDLADSINSYYEVTEDDV
jgi:serine/threonine protein kinase